MRTVRFPILLCLLTAAAQAQPAPAIPTTVQKLGVHQTVEILRDRWGVPHIYANDSYDLFFAQGFITAKDRLFQIDLWRRIGTGKLAEVQGPSAIPRDRIARLVRFRGNWDSEWKSYSPDTKQIATAFTNGINAYIRSLGGKRPMEFDIAGYDPGLWQPEDVTARVAGLLMTRNMGNEVRRAIDITKFGTETVANLMPLDPFRALDIPHGLDLASITSEITKDYTAATGPVRFPGEQGSNNWVIDGTLSATGKPILANDPHRPIQLPSLRKTVHLVAPGWNVIGAGEPALPGVALGHNENIAFGFTIVGIDQQDLYVEKLNPANPNQYRYKNEWKNIEIEHSDVVVKGEKPRSIELRYTLHGPIIHEDATSNTAYALRWVGSDPGGAGYLAALGIARAEDWTTFRKEMTRYKVPSENIVYADKAGNIGWIAAGLAPVRPNWSGLLPVPGDKGEYEWNGYLGIDDMPQAYNPAKHYVATANHNILPPGYNKQLSYEWASPERYHRIDEVLSSGRKFDIQDFAALQQDVTSLNARRFVKILGKDSPLAGWDAQLRTDSAQALLYEHWSMALPSAVFGPALASRVSLARTLQELETHPNPAAIQRAYEVAKTKLSADTKTWGDLHKAYFHHPLNRASLDLPPISRPGDGTTVNATGGANFRQTDGASYREVIDVSDWDRSIMTNVPGESGDPSSKHYGDLIQDWASGSYHPMPFSRKAVEAAAEERIRLVPIGK